jgi:homoserine kinase
MVPMLGEVLALDDPAVLGAFLSGAGPSVAVLARQDLERVEQMLASMYERAGVAATVRTLKAHKNNAQGPMPNAQGVDSGEVGVGVEPGLGIGH